MNYSDQNGGMQYLAASHRGGDQRRMLYVLYMYIGERGCEMGEQGSERITIVERQETEQ